MNLALTGLIGIAGGSYLLAGAYYNWDWFINDEHARPIVYAFGNGGARVFYTMLGAAMILAGAGIVGIGAIGT